MTKIKTLEALGFVPAFKGSQGWHAQGANRGGASKKPCRRARRNRHPAPIQYVVGLGRFRSRQRRRSCPRFDGAVRKFAGGWLISFAEIDRMGYSLDAVLHLIHDNVMDGVVNV